MNIIIFLILILVSSAKSNKISPDVTHFCEGVSDSFGGQSAIIQTKQCQNTILLNEKIIEEAFKDLRSFKIRKIIQGFSELLFSLKKISFSCFSAFEKDFNWLTLLLSEFNPEDANENIKEDFREVSLLLANTADEINNEKYFEGGKKFGQALKMIWFN